MPISLITIDPDASVSEAVRVMAKHGIRKLPVSRSNVLYGIFTARDVAKHFNEYEDRLTTDILKGMFTLSKPF